MTHRTRLATAAAVALTGGVIADGTPVIQWDFHAGDNQFWHYSPEKDPYA